MSDENQAPTGGVNVEGGGDVTVGGDVVARDKITMTTTHVGFSARDVQRLVITVGIIVFITAACFFSGGVVLGGTVLAALQTVGASDDPREAAAFQINVVDHLSSLRPGEPFTVEFTQDQISAYFRQRLGPDIGVSEGKVRLIEEAGRPVLVVGGKLNTWGNLDVAAKFEPQLNSPGEPLRLISAAVRLLSLGDSFGWVVVPAAWLPFTDQLHSLFGAEIELTSVTQTAPWPASAWMVSGVAR